MSFLNSFLAQLSVAAVPVMAALYVTENNIGLLAFLDLSVLRESSVELHHLRSSHLFPTQGFSRRADAF